jgi:GNAT superfamily N-acetyltransferase
MPCTYQRLLHPTDDELVQIKAIYEANFPPVMQKPFDVIRGGSRDGAVIVLVARDADRLVGMATLALLPRTATIYLGFLATDERLHNQGIGGALFRFMVDYVTAHTAADSLIWEVEGPEPDPAHLHNRRIRFYERQGAHVAALVPTYRMPDGAGDTIPLRIMWLRLRGDQTPPRPTEAAAWINDIYDLVYPGSDTLAAQIISEIDADQAG